MKHLLYIILLSLSFLSACKPRAEQKHREANDTIIAETPSGTVGEPSTRHIGNWLSY